MKPDTFAVELRHFVVSGCLLGVSTAEQRLRFFFCCFTFVLFDLLTVKRDTNKCFILLSYDEFFLLFIIIIKSWMDIFRVVIGFL